MGSVHTDERFVAILVATVVVAATIVGGVAFSGSQAAAAATSPTGTALLPGTNSITPGTVIDRPGVYTLSAAIDLSGRNTTGITIASSDVILDGNGLAIAGNGSAGSVGVLVRSDAPITNVTIRNLTVRDVGVGVLVDGPGTVSLVGGEVQSNAEANVVTRHDATAIGSGVKIGTAVPGNASLPDPGVLPDPFDVRVDFTMTNVRFADVGTLPPLPDGANRGFLGESFDATNTTGPGHLQVRLHYSVPSGASNRIDTDSLRLWRYDGTGWAVVGTGAALHYDYANGTWVAPTDDGFGTDPANHTLWADITAFAHPISTFVAVDGPFAPPNVSIGNTSLAPNPAEPTWNVSIDGTVSNTGDMDATVRVDLRVNGTTADSTVVAVPAHGAAPVHFERSFALGTYDIALSDAPVGTLRVVPDATPPVADAGGDKVVSLNASVTFDGSGSTDNVGIDAYNWTFGDGQNASGETVTHVFTALGTRTVTLTVADAAHNTDTDTATVKVVKDAPPVATIAGPDEATVGRPATFDGSGSFDYDGPVTYCWDFGDGTSQVSGAVVDHTFGAVGNYTVTLTVTDGTNKRAVATHEVLVVPDRPPVAVIEAPGQATVGEPVAFDGTNSSDHEAPIASYDWTFGDGGTATGPTPTHAFEAVGNYTVTLTVADDAGRTDADSLTVAVVNGTTPSGNETSNDTVAPIAIIDAPAQATVGEPATFSGANSTDDVGIVGYNWTFGDESSGSGANVTHTFAANGTYTVTLTVADAAGNTNATSGTIEVLSAPAGGDGSGGTDNSTDDSTSGGSGSASTGGGSGGSSSGSSGTSTRSRSVIVTYPSGNEARISVHNPVPNDTVTVPIRLPDASQCLIVDAVSFRTHDYRTVRLQVLQGADAPTNVSDWTTLAGDPGFGYVAVQTDSNVDQARLTFRLRTDCLNASGVDPATVRLYRYVDGDWATLPTHVVERTDGFVRYQADSPGFSTFAVGIAEPDVAVTDASLDRTTITAGETATLHVTLSNRGDLAGSFAAEFVSDGVVLETRTVTVDAGATTVLTFDHRFDTPGEYAISSGGVDAGTLVVAAPAAPTTTTTTGTDVVVPVEAGPGFAPLWLFLVIVGALLAGAYLLFREGGID